MLMERYWAGHTATLNATAQCDGHLGLLSHPEQDFALGWSNLVSFLGPSRFDVNYSMTTQLQELLPYRLLHDSDRPGHIPDMNKATNRGIRLVELLAEANAKTKGLFLREWQEAMCSSAARKRARDAINRGLTQVSVLVEDAVRIIWDLAFAPKNCSNGTALA